MWGAKRPLQRREREGCWLSDLREIRGEPRMIVLACSSTHWSCGGPPKFAAMKGSGSKLLLYVLAGALSMLPVGYVEAQAVNTLI